MIKVWMLVTILDGGFSMVPLDTKANCLFAASNVAANVTEAYCYEIEQIMPSNVLAPVLAPIPVPRPPDAPRSGEEKA